VTTWSHEPAGYDCPFCRIQRGVFDELNRPTDVVAVSNLAFARVAPRWWDRNPGETLVIPRAHHENLYGIPTAAGHAVWDLTQRVAVAMRTALECDGITTRQNNEPAGGQDIWHLHVHVLPRHDGDGLDTHDKSGRWVDPSERAEYADRLAAELGAPRDFS
jgi:histidine triad (HIT) family protein